MSDERVSHWLTRTSATRVPRRLVCLDSEATITRTLTSQTHTFRLAAASFDLLGADHQPTGRTMRADFTDELALWRWVVDRCAVGARTLVWAHNIAYDLRLTRGLDLLPELGFELKGLALTQYSCWARFSDGRRGLTLTDTSSWLPQSLDRIAADVGLDHRPLPPWNAGDAAWARRCRADVDVLRHVVLALVRLVVDHQLGDFRLTGAAQGSAAFRRRFLKPSQLLVHDDAEALTAERRGAWTGRCELWRHGAVDATVYEYDFDAAYARVAATDTVPGRMLGGHTPLPLGRLREAVRTMAVLTDCTVTTEQPVAPAELNGATVWPVGTFRTTLWDRELLAAVDAGATIAGEWCYLYDRSAALQEWAAWILAALDGAPPGDTAIGRMVAKGWSRSCIGRFGLRYQDLNELARADDSKLVMFPVRDSATGAALTWLQVGRQLYERTGLVETSDSLPQITSYVMAAARARLWTAMRAVGLDRLLYVDTDGFLTTAAPRSLQRVLGPSGGFPDLRLKSTWAGATLRSPRNLDVGHTRRVAGVPKDAAMTAPDVYQYEAWDTLPGALRRSRADRVVVTERTAAVAGHDPRRLHLPRGATSPLRLAVVDGVNQLAPPA